MGLMRYWDEVDACWIEGEPIWNGKGAMPHEAADSLYWRQKYAAEVCKPSNEHGKYLTTQDLKGKANADIRFDGRSDTGTGCKCQVCGRWVYGMAGSKCAKCRHRRAAKQPTEVRLACGCGRPFTANQIARKVKRCVHGSGCQKRSLLVAEARRRAGRAA
jgi:hypothetical protein